MFFGSSSQYPLAHLQMLTTFPGSSEVQNTFSSVLCVLDLIHDFIF